MIGITADFSDKDLEDWINADAHVWFDELLEKFRIAGKQFTERARAKAKPEKDAFGNITWNLRSSIGYVLVYQRKVIEAYFPVLKTGSLGAKTGESFAREIALLINEGDGIELVMVAGMEYASLVEDRRLDVISGSSALFEAEVTKLLAA